MLISLYSGISGMGVQEKKQDVIANNIANVGTTAFKFSRVRFQDMMSQTSAAAMSPSSTQGGTNPRQIGLGVQLAGIDTIMNTGSMQPTNRPLDAAIDGEGYFLVAKGPKTFDSTGITVDADHNTKVNNGTELMYSRDGAFGLDSEGNLLSSDGYRILGFSVTGIVPTTIPTQGVCQINLSTAAATDSVTITPPTSLSANASTISFSGISDLVSKINSDPELSALYTASTSGSSLILTQKSGKETSSPTTITLASDSTTSTTPTAGKATVPATAVQGVYKIDAPSSPLTINGTSITFTTLDDLISQVNNDGTLKNLYTASKSGTDLILTQAKGTESSTAPTTSGTLTTLVIGSPAGASIKSSSSIDTSGNIIFADAKNTITADKSSLKTLRIPDYVYPTSADAAAGTNGDKVLSFSIEKDGQIKAVLASGSVSTLGQIAMASFKNPGGLEKMGKNLYSVSSNSGTPTLRSAAGDTASDNSGAFGDMLGNTLEMSNVDLANEFTEMIVSSRAFQACGKIISTGDEILQDIINLKR